jgi:hypothetical protein
MCDVCRHKEQVADWYVQITRWSIVSFLLRNFHLVRTSALIDQVACEL